MDDILIYSNSEEEHEQHVRLILQKLIEHGLYVKLEKCVFNVPRISFLGYIISDQGIEMDPSRIQSIVDWPAPSCVRDIQIFLGFANFYRRFIDGYSRVVCPITNLLKKGQWFIWSSEAQAAFDELKSRFTTAPILRHFDPSLPITLHPDSSGFAISCILSQPHDGQLHPVAFWSRKCIPAECNYDIHDRELLVIVEAIKHWRHYLEGSRFPFKIFSDHKNLEVFMTTKILNRRQARWAELLSSYDFTIIPIPGKKNSADGLSRRPDYAQDVVVPSGTIVPPAAFQPTTSDQSTGIPGAQQLFSVSNSVALPSNQLMQRFLDALSSDPFARDFRANPQSYSKLSWSPEGLLLRNNLIYVPQDDELRLELLKMHHDESRPSSRSLRHCQNL